MTAEALFEVITVHCCFCLHVVRQTEPQAAHDGMEDHYAEKHGALIDRLLGQVS